MQYFKLSNFKSILIASLLLFAQQVKSEEINNMSELALNANLSDTTELRADYLSKIYFSGENSEGLKLKCLQTIQLLSGQRRTQFQESQYIFLVEVKEQIDAENDACDILDIISVGIYDLDANTAQILGVKLPGTAAKRKAALGKDSFIKLKEQNYKLREKLTNGDSAQQAPNGGKSQQIKKKASNVNEKAATTIQDIETFIDIASLIPKGNKKDKPCKSVKSKEILIGVHKLPSLPDGFNSINIQISKISSANLRKIAEEIKKKKGVQSIDKQFSEEESTLTVIYCKNAEELADWVDEKFSTQLKLIKYDNAESIIILVSQN